MNTQPKDLRAELASVLARFDELLQRLRGQLADSTSDFAYPIIRDYANELGDIRAALTSHGGGGEAVAWREGYRAGVNDERMSEANIGVAGYNAKIEPARENPYRTTPQPRSEGMVLEQLRRELAEDKGWDYTEYEKGRIAEKERCISLLAAAPGEGRE